MSSGIDFHCNSLQVCGSLHDTQAFTSFQEEKLVHDGHHNQVFGSVEWVLESIKVDITWRKVQR